MNFGKKQIEKRIQHIDSNVVKLGNKIIIYIVGAISVALIISIIIAVCTGYGIIKGILADTPDVNASNMIPLGYATSVYDSKGNLTDTLVMEGSNREEATYDEIPKDLINAFVAIEDARFWQHKGIDTRSIIRAVVGVIRGDSSSGGGSTITQQLIKNNIFNGGREKSFGDKIERKIQEQYLALQLEQKMDKKIILQNYLNTINLGNNTLGVKTAARRYFDKDVSELTLSECAVIAGITQNPSKFNPISGQEANAEKRKIILQYMYEQGYITKEEQEEALEDDVYARIRNIDTISKESLHTYSYFTDELIDQVTDALIDKLGYSATAAHNLIYSGGLSIYTTQDPDLQSIVDSEVNNEDNYSNTRYSVEYRLSISSSDGTISNYDEKTLSEYHKSQISATWDGLYHTEEEARIDCENYKASLLSEGNIITGESINIILEPQVSFVLIEQSTGEVKALCGGRGSKQASLTLNRASDTKRQPGSAFKVLSSFAPAIDACGMTLGSVYYDAPYKVGEKDFSNWYSNYTGWSSIRDGIIYSMNIVAVKCMMDTVTPQLGVEYCKNLGITTLTDTDYNAATALGGLTDGVTNLELTTAYAAIANGGMYNKPKLFTKILDHDGKVLIDNESQPQRVLKESTAFLLTDAMSQSMKHNTKFGASISATSARAGLDDMNCAGKSGTTTSNVDIWFVGYTPYYTAGIWAGCDENQSLGSSVGGNTSFHKDIWKKIMAKIHENLTDIGFSKPYDIEEAQICRKSGKLAISGICDHDPRGNATYTEYFAKGTVPTEVCDHHATVNVCSISGKLPTDYCPSLISKVVMIVPDNEGYTSDSNYSYPTGICTLHTAPAIGYVPSYQNNQNQITNEPSTGYVMPIPNIQ